MFSSLVIASFFISFIYAFQYFMQRLLVIEDKEACPPRPNQPKPAND
ncbi:hypothetical protein [Vacuolonema iberomarrocanum]|nr:hypothetical protein [filamentous cyanobacterium LEGE 07170]